MKLINGGRLHKESKGGAQGGPPRHGFTPVEVKTTLEPTLFDIDLTVHKVFSFSLLLYPDIVSLFQIVTV